MFCACEHHRARRQFQQSLDLELSPHSAWQKGEFEEWIRADKPTIEKAALGFLSCVNVSGFKEWPKSNCRIYVFKLEPLVRHDHPYYYDEFDGRIFRIPGAIFCDSVAHVFLQTSIWHLFGRDCYKVFESDVKDD